MASAPRRKEIGEKRLEIRDWGLEICSVFAVGLEASAGFVALRDGLTTFGGSVASPIGVEALAGFLARAVKMTHSSGNNPIDQNKENGGSLSKHTNKVIPKEQESYLKYKVFQQINQKLMGHE